ncbi:bacterio-opsin activator domain-containing protein [Halobaculum magnesiiphilum]|uniref:histidine kinase n=1 Tax=Halobaculum magnesiiphilum TaxID=1017351 RepID=A0A8T8WHV3_9EURY|nr:bacterio-opsin activator domain-containing protein [Halobaculum magnesiiphilum]QZP39420.1 PAS domain S-box protein [Halobaculum magnesiiphilum]
MEGGRQIYEEIFNSAKDAIFLYNVIETDSDYEFKLRQLNPAHEAKTGLSADECRGATPREILDEPQGSEVTANLCRCADREETISYEEVLELPSGKRTWRTKLTPVIRDGDVIQIIGIARDITGQKERIEALRRAREQLHVALEATNTGVWEWNVETDEVLWNDALERLVGIEPGTFEGTYDAFTEYLHPEDIQKVERAITEVIEGSGPFEVEFRMVRTDGDTIWVLGRGELYTRDGPRRLIGTTTDITDRKENELALARREIIDPSIELELHSEEIADLLREEFSGGMYLSFDGIVPGPDQSWLLYVTVEGITPTEVRATLDTIPTAEDARLLSTRDEQSRYEVVVGPNSVAARFRQFDGNLRSIIVEGGTCRLVGEFPETVDPVTVVETVRETFPDVELASQNRIASPTYLRTIIEEQLTERQQTVLGMAYHAGYFEQPRNVTGEELASRLNITRQTFNTHLRKAQLELFQELFEEQLEFPD